MILADSDVLIDFLQDEGESERVREEIDRGNLCTSAVSRFELLAGARSDGQLAITRQLLAALPTVRLDEAAADRGAAVRRQLDEAGQRIAMADCLIAGIALENALPVLTRNRRHFARVEGLLLA